MKALFVCGVLLGLIYFSEGGPLRLFKRAVFYIANETACVVDDQVYANGEPIPTEDPCEQCRCRPPGFACVLKECIVKPGCRAMRREGECCPDYVCGCEHNGRFYLDGDEIRDEKNPCYQCHCQGSAIACAFQECAFRPDCPPAYLEGECCPRYEHCDQPGLSLNDTLFDTSVHHVEEPIYESGNPPVPELTELPSVSERIPAEENPETKQPTVPEEPAAEVLVPEDTEPKPLQVESLTTNSEPEATTPSSKIGTTTEVDKEPEVTSVSEVENAEINLLKAVTEVKSEESEKVNKDAFTNEETTSLPQPSNEPSPVKSDETTVKYETTFTVSSTESVKDSDIDNIIDYEKRLRSLKNITELVPKDTETNETETTTSEDVMLITSAKSVVETSSVVNDVTTVGIPDTENKTDVATEVESKNSEIDEAKILLYSSENEKEKKEHVETVTYTFLVVDPDEKKQEENVPKKESEEETEKKTADEKSEKKLEEKDSKEKSEDEATESKLAETTQKEPAEDTTESKNNAEQVVTSEIPTDNPVTEESATLKQKTGTEASEIQDSRATEKPESRSLDDKESSTGENELLEKTQTQLEIKDPTQSSIIETYKKEVEDKNTTEIPMHQSETPEESSSVKEETTSQATTERSQNTTELIEKTSGEPASIDALTEFILKNNQPKDQDKKQAIKSADGESDKELKEL